ncbi:hypothetical protein ACVJ1F_001261 [Frigoribacterium sp. 2355]
MTSPTPRRAIATSVVADGRSADGPSFGVQTGCLS